MAGNDSGGGDHNVPNLDGFRIAAGKMDSDVISPFQAGMQKTAAGAGATTAKGTMPEGIAFMADLATGRDTLVQFMSKTADGFQGYSTAIKNLDAEHQGLVAINKSRLQTLLRPHDGPVPTNAAFDHPGQGGH